MKKHVCALTKRAIAFFMCALFVICVPLSAAAQDEGIDFTFGCPDTKEASAVYLCNLESGKVLASKNLDGAISPSSSAKMMTGLLALEYFGDDLSQKIKVSTEMLEGVSGNLMKIKPSEIYSAEQLIYGVVCAGYNDAAAVLAHFIGGSESEFVRMMNERAMEFGMVATIYANPTGIQGAATTTLSDVVLLSKKAYENERYLKISSATRYDIPADADSIAHSLTNRNALIYGREVRYRNVYAKGLFAGSDGDYGYCVGTVVQKKGLSYLCIVMGAYQEGEDIYSYIVANRLCSWALSKFENRDVIDKKMFSYSVNVTSSNTVDTVNAVPAENVSAFLPVWIDDDDLTFRVCLHEPSANAPVKMGDELGFLIVSVGEEEVARTLLVSESDVSASKFMKVMERLGEVTTSRFFIIFVIVFIIISTCVIMLFSKRNKREQNRNRYRCKL